MRRTRRLDHHPRTTLARGAPLTFQHDGRLIEAFEGESVAGALYAAGQRVLSRSMRYHRPRGLYCATGGCTHCFLRIDGVPNQRSCQTACQPGAWTEGQNAWPNVRTDFLALADVAFPHYLDAHRSFTRPALVRRPFYAVARRMAGFGRVPAQAVTQTFLHAEENPDVLIVGAGPAGLSAARAAAQSGVSVLVAEAVPEVGGRLRHTTRPFAHHAGAPQDAEGKSWTGKALAVATNVGARVQTGLRVFGHYEGTWKASTSTRLVTIRPRAVVLANGNLDAPTLLPGADRAGVLLPTAAATLLNVHGIVPAEPVAILGADRDAMALAVDLAACGVRMAGLFDPRSEADLPSALLAEARAAKVPIQLGWKPAYVAGRARARAVVFDTPSGRERVPAGAVVASNGRSCLSELVQQAGARLVVREGGVWPVLDDALRATVPGLWVAGGAAGATDPWESVLQGVLAGAAAAATLRPEDSTAQTALEDALAATDALRAVAR